MGKVLLILFDNLYIKGNSLIMIKIQDKINKLTLLHKNLKLYQFDQNLKYGILNQLYI
jgi:hypothetical protein